MTQIQNPQQYDLEDRTLTFARDVLAFVRSLPMTITNAEDIKQVVRSSGFVGANYIEANEALSKKDFVMRIKICRKEAKETGYWLKLVELKSKQHKSLQQSLIQESTELTSIFGAILQKC